MPVKTAKTEPHHESTLTKLIDCWRKGVRKPDVARFRSCAHRRPPGCDVGGCWRFAALTEDEFIDVDRSPTYTVTTLEPDERIFEVAMREDTVDPAPRLAREKNHKRSTIVTIIRSRGAT
ncbi:hypothetical protein GE21DRAFT_5530 [Neurospora crassa]|uniref:Uncharacterized protein n=1 Tax=Neurospora crassa (strain ATCC 24698 / 74-OR23-1A / CBS 708.71 / DSM 1257 / FGSC 987) TaxID=367110 RepID=Q7S876_NEUCR|nr:hypothetical protein NCU06517 [Neurospora crassa OR74A]EAA32538.1 hypothetical protein NCU06517 [Neurospora crassa OR74A]KHE79089.1 hypothetical protein GE21DRAFT_5530 [Neurospora crassa]|eukprot:XP_961774.1 hypothetical protein NCU06517 [Neurospora crassa OR74A]